jgi:spermidine/putrescine transport system ATP-binding protein
MIEVRCVTKRFGDLVAVRSVSLDIRRGEFLTLLGPSGCGKTTLLRLIAGFDSPSEGRVFLDGADVTELPPYRRNVNQVFQSYALFPHLDVAANIAFGLQMKRLPRAEIAEKVRRAISLVALDGKERARPSALSGGQKQRVALARALVCEPKVLLLDEPLSALDAKLREQMQIELKHLQRRLGITFVFVTHDQQEALTMSDRIAVVNQGSIEQIGTADEIYHKPRTRFVAEFVGEANLLMARITGSSDTGATLRLSDGTTLTVEPAAMPDRAADVLISIRPERIHVGRSSGTVEDSGFDGKIAEITFRGQTARLLVRTVGGLAFTVVVASGSSTQSAWQEGDPVRCLIHPRDIIVLPQEKVPA